MAEYIEREALIEDFKNCGADKGLVDAIVYRINQHPAADVEVVRHGEWNENIIGFCNVCMECGAIVERTAIKNKSGELNYCPNCGAKMDGKGDG